MRRTVVAIGLAGVLVVGAGWLAYVNSSSGRGDGGASGSTVTTVASAQPETTTTAETPVPRSVLSRDDAVLVEIEDLFTSISEDRSALAEIVAPEMRLAVDLNSALPDGATIVPDDESLLVSRSTAALFATVSLPTGEADRFLVVFAQLEGEWLLASTLRVGGQ